MSNNYILFKQNSHIDTPISKFFVEFGSNYNSTKLNNCSLICYNKKGSNNLSESDNIMFTTHIFIKTNDTNIFEINFWNHNKPIHLELLDENHKILLQCNGAVNFYYTCSNEKINENYHEFWYKNYLGQYGMIRIMAGLWCHGFANLDSNKLNDLDTLLIWKNYIKKYFDDVNFDKEEFNITVPENVRKLIPDNIITNDCLTHYVDDNTMQIYSFNNKDKQWYYIQEPQYYLNLINNFYTPVHN